MAPSDSDVRESLASLISAFADSPDQIAKRSGFHLYCMEVAMGFKFIYKKIFDKTPPGLAVDKLQNNCVRVVSSITVHDIGQLSSGASFSEDVRDVMDYIENTKNVTKKDLWEAQRKWRKADTENVKLKQRRDKIVLEVADATKKILETKNSERLLEIENEKKQMEALQKAHDERIAELESELAKSKQDTAVAREEARVTREQNKILGNFSSIDGHIAGIRDGLNQANKRFYDSNTKIVEHIQRLIGPGTVVNSAVVSELKLLFPAGMSAGIPQADLDEKNKEINDLQLRVSTLEAEVVSKDSELATNTQEIARLSLELSQKSGELLTCQTNLKDLKKSCTSCESLLKKYFKFCTSIDVTMNNVYASKIQAQKASIDTAELKCFEASSHQTLKDGLKSCLCASLAIIAFGYIKKMSFTEISEDVVNSMNSIASDLPLYSDIFQQTCVASYGFTSLGQFRLFYESISANYSINNISNCNYVEKTIGYDPADSDNQDDSYTTFSVNTEPSDDPTIKFTVLDTITWFSRQYHLLKQTVTIMIHWLDKESDINNLKVISSYVRHVIESMDNTDTDILSLRTLIDKIIDKDLVTMLGNFKIALIGQVFKLDEGTVTFLSGDVIPSTSLKESVEKYLSFLNGEIVDFDDDDSKNLKLMHLPVIPGVQTRRVTRSSTR